MPKAIVKDVIKKLKDVPKRVPHAPQQLVNEHQETIFNTELTVAADDYAKAVMEHRLWGEKKQSAEKELIFQMKEAKIMKMVMGADKVIKYKFVESKEVVTIKDFKPRVPGRRSRS